jgi:hypothetical protein
MIGPGLFSVLFANSLATHAPPGTPFYVAAALLLAAVLAAWPSARTGRQIGRVAAS